MRHLRLQRARVDDFSQRRVRRQRQKVTRNIESAGAQRPLVGILLHVSGFRRNPAEILKHGLGKPLVVDQQLIERLPVERAGGNVIAKIRSVVAALAEVLIASGALLAIPTLLVGDNDRGQN